MKIVVVLREPTAAEQRRRPRANWRAHRRWTGRLRLSDEPSGFRREINCLGLFRFGPNGYEWPVDTSLSQEDPALMPLSSTCFLQPHRED